MRSTKTFRAGTMREALALVRRDLGGDAVILHTREVRKRRLLGLGQRELVEVTATLEPVDPPSSAAKTEDQRAGRQRTSGPKKSAERRNGARSTDRHSVSTPSQDEAAAPGLDAELRHLHSLVEELSRHGRIDHLLPEVPSELVPIYANLLDAEVPEALARRLVRDIAESLEPEDIHRPDAVRLALREAIGGILPIAPPIATVPGTCRVVALIGPTGVGKTTTVAKLAANFKLIQKLEVGLVTVDTYRIAAIEQLRTYAEIIDLPLAIANDPSDMRSAIESLGKVDLVLIDTAGRSPRDEVKIRELADFLAEARPDEVHLVLSAVATERSLRATVERFATAHPDRIILTKLDEAEGLGGALAVVGHSNRPISYLTTGQSVPDDIEPASRARLARLILGDEVVI